MFHKFVLKESKQILANIKTYPILIFPLGSLIGATTGAIGGVGYGFYNTSKNYINNDDISIIRIPAMTFINGGEGMLGGFFIGSTLPITIPALILSMPVYGYKEWLIHGNLHRKDGPAVECVMEIKNGG